MRSPLRLTTLLLVLAAAVPTAAAARAPGYDGRTFKLDVEGRQTSTWTLHRVAADACDISVDGNGSETTTFRTRKAVRVTLKRFGTSYVMVGDQPAFELGLRATVKRAGTLSHTTVPASCGDNGGGVVGENELPDCGTKTADLTLELAYANEGRRGFSLATGLIRPLGDLFRNCPWNGAHGDFPDIVETTTKGKPIIAAISADELFDRKTGQMITIARGTKTDTGGGTTTSTSIRWSVRLTRV